jgi:glycerophosphoryl diester phosphodiesterase
MAKLQAHRGVSSGYPENTIAAFVASVKEGYDYIEFDPKYTLDGEIVILHDQTLDRTARMADGTKLPEGIKIWDITLEEARGYDYGLWFDESFRGEKIPLLSELLEFAKETQIPIKVDNVWESFPEQMKEKLFSEIEKYGDSIKVGFTCAKLETLAMAAKRFPKADIHYDGGDLSAERLEEVKRLSKGHHLYVWVCFDNDMTWWFKGTKATPEVCKFVRQYGELGVWILSKREELEVAIKELDAEIIETTGHIKPEWVSEIN